LTPLPLFAQSLQSIMGATLIFLFKFNVLSRIPNVTFQGISAILLRIITRSLSLFCKPAAACA